MSINSNHVLQKRLVVFRKCLFMSRNAISDSVHCMQGNFSTRTAPMSLYTLENTSNSCRSVYQEYAIFNISAGSCLYVKKFWKAIPTADSVYSTKSRTLITVARISSSILHLSSGVAIISLFLFHHCHS